MVSLPTETQPLLQKETVSRRKCAHILICAFIITLSITLTRVPMLYVVREMACDDYYSTEPRTDRLPDPNRCRTALIEAKTGNSLSLLGTVTTLTGVLNLFTASWLIGKFGVKPALIHQTIWPAARSALQILAMKIGGSRGISVILLSQLVCAFGGSTGYLLVTNTYVVKLIAGPEQTGVLGILQGFVMFGTAVGYFMGGFLGDLYGIASPFYSAFILMFVSMCYSIVFLPSINPDYFGDNGSPTHDGRGTIMQFLRLFTPQNFVSPCGKSHRRFDVILLCSGIFFGVLATGCIPIIIQLYATSAFNFHPTQNGYLMAINFLTRGLFLSIAFPKIIDAGRQWFNSRSRLKTMGSEAANSPALEEFAGLVSTLEQERPKPNSTDPAESACQVANVGSRTSFDLFFLKASLLLDAILTASAAFSRRPWHIYLAAVLLPFASGSAPAAKGVMIEMCPPSQRDDALTALSLIETVATVLTMSVFGKVYAILAEHEIPGYVFIFTAGVSTVAVLILAWCRFPPSGFERMVN